MIHFGCLSKESTARGVRPGRGSVLQGSPQGGSQFHRHLEVVDLAVPHMPADVRHLEQSMCLTRQVGGRCRSEWQRRRSPETFPTISGQLYGDWPYVSSGVSGGRSFPGLQ